MLDCEPLEHAIINNLVQKFVKLYDRLGNQFAFDEDFLWKSYFSDFFGGSLFDLGWLCIKIFSKWLVMNFWMIDALERSDATFLLHLAKFLQIDGAAIIC